MKKKELLELIQMANNAEEKMVENLADHLSSALEWFKGTKNEVEQLRTGLKKLQEESAEHAKFLDSLKKKIEKEGKDVY